MRDYAQLATVHKPGTNYPTDYLWSPKIDGVRAIWIPTLRGKMCPAFTGSPVVCTGLMTRYGKPIYAPNWFLDALPPFPLDGELTRSDQLTVKMLPKAELSPSHILVAASESIAKDYDQDSYMIYSKAPQAFQSTVSAVKKHFPVESEWREIHYLVFASPSYEELFATGRINNNIVSHFILGNNLRPYLGQDFKGARLAKQQIPKLYQHWVSKTPGPTKPMPWTIISQRQLDSHRQIEAMFEAAQALGFEGLIGRRALSVWSAKRTKDIVKLKPYTDDEAVVSGYEPGIGKHEGRLGSYRVSWLDPKGVRRTFNLSGMTDAERNNPLPLGATLTFKYRTVSDDGIPREARYTRVREAL